MVELNLDKKQLDLLKAIIKKHIPHSLVWAYGVRVNGEACKTSDLDLAVFGASDTQIYDLRENLMDSNLLISVDVLRWDTIPKDFKTNIKRQHVVVQEEY